MLHSGEVPEYRGEIACSAPQVQESVPKAVLAARRGLRRRRGGYNLPRMCGRGPMRRILAKVAACLAAMAAFAAAGQAGDAWSELQACRSLGNAERLACFDRVLASHNSAPAPVAAAKPDADFGAERLPQNDATPQQPESMTAKVAQVRWNPFKHFSITLDNGQVWRQIDADSETAVGRLKPAATVKITRGFLGSYSLAVEGEWGIYKVKRIQ